MDAAAFFFSCDNAEADAVAEAEEEATEAEAAACALTEEEEEAEGEEPALALSPHGICFDRSMVGGGVGDRPAHTHQKNVSQQTSHHIILSLSYRPRSSSR